MKPLTDEALILHYYGESPDAAAIERHLAQSPADRARLDELRGVLDAVPPPEAPERSDVYGAEVWRRLAPRLERKGWWQSLAAPPRRWLPVAAMLLAVALSFVAGRYWPGATRSQERWAASPEARQRVLLAAVTGHLERTEMLLLELTNAGQGRSVDLSVERSLAGELSAEGRLYRQAAELADQPALASMLDEIERLLVDLSHGPAETSAEDVERLRQRLDERDILFRLRIVLARLHRESTAGLPAGVAAPTI
jgi:hypothetical protein